MKANPKLGKTAIARKEPSRPARWLVNRGWVWRAGFGEVLDFACGRGKDADYYGWDKYDAHWFPKEPKARASHGKWSIVVCTYLLNVLTEEQQTFALFKIRDMLSPNGYALITVRRDIPRKGTKTQRWVELPGERKLFEDRAMCIYIIIKTPGSADEY